MFDADFGVCGARKVWRQPGREGKEAARCTAARLMRKMGLQGVVRGREVRTTVSNPAAPCPPDRVNRQFHAPRPNALWLSDFTYVATWQGFVCVAFVIDAYARHIVGWRVSRTARAAFVLDALEQALADRRPLQGGGLVHHSDRGVPGTSLKLPRFRGQLQLQLHGNGQVESPTHPCAARGVPGASSAGGSASDPGFGWNDLWLAQAWMGVPRMGAAGEIQLAGSGRVQVAEVLAVNGASSSVTAPLFSSWPERIPMRHGPDDKQRTWKGRPPQ